MKSESYLKREAELKKEYEEFLKTEEGQKWLEEWKDASKDNADAGDFGDYLYDFHTEMLL